MKTRIKFCSDEAADFHDKEIPKVNTNLTCLAIIFELWFVKAKNLNKNFSSLTLPSKVLDKSGLPYVTPLQLHCQNILHYFFS